MNVKSNNGEFAIDFSNQMAGVYIIKVIADERLFTGKVIVN